MVKRAIALFLAVLIGIGAIIPLATQQAEAGSRKFNKHRRHAKYKKYSKGWWRQYRARMKRKRAMQAARRELRLRQLRMEQARAKDSGAATPGLALKPGSSKNKKTNAQSTGVLPSGNQAPAGWTPSQATAAELQFRVDNSAGDQIGSASISVVGPSRDNGGRQSVGGVSTTMLRRNVIDKMIKENGWVVNDYQKSIGGRSV